MATFEPSITILLKETSGMAFGDDVEDDEEAEGSLEGRTTMVEGGLWDGWKSRAKEGLVTRSD